MNSLFGVLLFCIGMSVFAPLFMNFLKNLSPDENRDTDPDVFVLRPKKRSSLVIGILWNVIWGGWTYLCYTQFGKLRRQGTVLCLPNMREDYNMHEELIQNVMKMILSGDDLMLDLLRKQYHSAIIKSIECSSVGFFANFEIVSNGIEVELFKNQFQIGDIYGSVDNLEYAVGFILFVKNGKINMLEGYTNILDFWPQDDAINLSYSTGGTRDYISLKKNWQKN